jgi:uncharacterized caspase-like protein
MRRGGPAWLAYTESFVNGSWLYVRALVGILFFPVLGSPFQAQERRTYAVLVGINKYKDAAPAEFLSYADRDASSFQEHLGRVAGGPAQGVFSFTDFSKEKPTLTRVKNKLEEVLTMRAGPRDDVYVFISARGRATYESRDGYISAWDTERQRPGTALRVSDLDKLQQGVFGYSLVRALDGEAQKDSSGKVTAKGLYDYVRQEVGRWTNGQQRPYPNPRVPNNPVYLAGVHGRSTGWRGRADHTGGNH